MTVHQFNGKPYVMAPLTAADCAAAIRAFEALVESGNYDSRERSYLTGLRERFTALQRNFNGGVDGVAS